MYARIVVGVDDSEPSARALAEALRLARHEQARVNLVHVVDTVALYWGSDDFRGASRVEEVWRAKGRDLLARCRQRAIEAGVEAETTLLVPEGEGVDTAIVDISRRWQADLIVAGTHGRRGLRRLLMGSVAEGLSRASTVTVLVVAGRNG